LVETFNLHDPINTNDLNQSNTSLLTNNNVILTKSKKFTFEELTADQLKKRVYQWSHENEPLDFENGF